MAHLMRLSSRQIPVLHRCLSASATLNSGAELTEAQRDAYFPKLGNRDIVGYGFNGLPTYIDKEEFPAPAVRYGENTSEVLALREKEQGDWKALTLDEKKALYRASFRQTYSEMTAPTGEWKAILAATLLGLSVTGWMMIWMKQFVYPPLPSTITDEWKEEQVKVMVIQRQGPIEGVASQFDYDNNKWK